MGMVMVFRGREVARATVAVAEPGGRSLSN